MGCIIFAIRFVEYVIMVHEFLPHVYTVHTYIQFVIISSRMPAETVHKRRSWRWISKLIFLVSGLMCSNSFGKLIYPTDSSTTENVLFCHFLLLFLSMYISSKASHEFLLDVVVNTLRPALGYSETILKVIYHPLYSVNKFVTNKSKLPQDGAHVFPYMGWLAIMWSSERVTW